MSKARHFDQESINRLLTELIDPSVGCVEVRAFNCVFKNGMVVPPADQFSRTIAGYYSDSPTAARDVRSFNGVSAYVTVNPVKHALLSRKKFPETRGCWQGRGYERQPDCLHHKYLRGHREVDPKV